MSKPGRALFVLLFFALALLPFGTIPYGAGFPGQHDLIVSDLLHAHLPYRTFLGQRLADGALPLWWPDVFSGTPLVAQIEAGTFYLPQWPFYALLDPYLAFDLSTGLTVLVSAAGAWLWARSLGASPVAAAFAGVAFAGCGWNISHVKHPSLHAAAAWVPWVLWSLERALDRERPLRGAWPLAGALLAMQTLAGMPQVTWMLSLAFAARVAIAAGIDLASGERRRALTTGIAGAAAGVLGLGAAAVQLLPTVLFSRETLRPPSMTAEASTEYDVGLQALLTMVFPQAAGAPLWFRHGGTIQWEAYAFCGVSTLLLAAVGLARGKGREGRLAWTAIGAAALLLSFGGGSPLFGAAWVLLPGIRMFRFHQRWLLFVQLVAAALAALGLDALRDALTGRTKRLVPPAAVCVVAFEITLAAGPFLPVDPIDAWRSPIAAEERMKSAEGRVFMMDALGPWFDAYMENHGLADAGSAPLIAKARWPIGSMPAILGQRSPSGYVNLVESRVGRLWMYDEHFPLDRSTLLPQWADARLPEQAEVRVPPLPSLPEPRFAALLSRASVDVVVADHAAEIATVGWEDLGESDGLHVWRNPAALPRAYVARRWQPVDAEGAVAALHASPPPDPRVPLVETAQQPPPDAPIGVSPAAVREPWPERVEVEVAEGGGWLVLTDTLSAGWTATLDGSPVPIALANGWQRAVWVPEGAHDVVFEYRAPGLREGALVSAVCLAALAAWGLLRGRPAAG